MVFHKWDDSEFEDPDYSEEEEEEEECDEDQPNGFLDADYSEIADFEEDSEEQVFECSKESATYYGDEF